MIDYIILFVYFSVVVLIIWPLKQCLLTTVVVYGKPNSLDQSMSSFIAAIAALLWPLWLTVLLAVKASKIIWDRILNEDERDANERVDESS